MDPFSITVGAPGITEFAVSSIVQLHDFINDLDQVEEVLQDVALILEGIQRPLNTLEALSIADGRNSDAAKEDLKKTGVVEAVNNCGQACDKLSKNLKKWTKHCGSAKYSLRDRLSVGVWNKEKIRTFKRRFSPARLLFSLLLQVHCCKPVLDVTLWETCANIFEGSFSSVPRNSLRPIARI
jgi:Fungal N-terminal domain of STAND proteins